MAKDKPIIHFSSLTNTLNAMGIYVNSNGSSWREIKSEDVRIDELQKGSLVIEPSAIYSVDEFGNRVRVFLYKREYHINEHGYPRKHYCNCQTIRSFTNDAGQIPLYRKSNIDKIKVYDLDSDEETIVTNAPTCYYCMNILRRELGDKFNIKKLLESALPANTPRKLKINYAGYTDDWPVISADIRKKRNYTCEVCNIKVDDFDAGFLEVHHKNGNKADNREQNLQCLCIRCHSQVNQTHRSHYTSDSKRMLISLFEEKYLNKK